MCVIELELDSMGMGDRWDGEWDSGTTLREGGVEQWREEWSRIGAEQKRVGEKVVESSVKARVIQMGMLVCRGVKRGLQTGSDKRAG